MTRGQVPYLTQVRNLVQVPSAPLRVLRLFFPIVRLQYPFVTLRGHILEARLKDRCLLFRQDRPLEHLLQNLVAPNAAMVRRVGLRTGRNGRLKSGRLSGACCPDGTWRIEPAELHEYFAIPVARAASCNVISVCAFMCAAMCS
jgi:hypothetical protein